MDYKEKYEKALQKIRELIEIGKRDGLTIIFYEKNFEEIFPELSDSGDERIRKELIHLVKKSHEQGGYALHKYEADRMIAWLEKQETSYTKRDVDDAYVEGMAFAKDELEKQNPTWSEDDEKMKDLIISVLEINHSKGIFKVGLRAIRTEEIVYWLKSLKQRYT